MKKKIIGVLFCILLIISVLTTTGFKTNDGPHVEIIWPPDNYETDQSTITLIGYAGGEFPINEYGYTIQYPDGGIFSEFWPISPPLEYYEFEISVTLAEGENGNRITVYAKDTQTGQGTDAVTVIYTPSGEDTEPPEVLITYPEDGQIFLDSEIILQGYASDNVGIVFFSVINYWNEEEFEIYSITFTDPQPFYEFQFNIVLKPGKNNIVVSANDEAQNKDGDSINITQTQCNHEGPIISDSSGNTTFHGVFIGCDHRNTPSIIPGAEKSAETMYDTLRNMPGWDTDNMEIFLGDEANFSNIKNAIARAIDRAQPGDEFLFYFADHGSNNTFRDTSGEEPDDFDEALMASDRFISDDELTILLSNFSDCVTITVKLDCCHSGGFADGTNDTQNATNSDGQQYGSDHINLDPACGADELTYYSPYFWQDDGDMIIEPGELTYLDQYNYTDLNDNGRWDMGEPWWWWYDADGDGMVTPDELYEENQYQIVRLGRFTKANLDGLANGNSFKKDGSTNADRNKDGITTTKEWYEYSINALYMAHYGDDDKDGLIDEDGPEYEETSDGVKILYIDNDRDGLIDEDPAPPSFAFWYDKKPTTPTKPTGQVNGKINTDYTYSSMSTDPEYDDIYYWFDWGDGTNSGWVGPYMSGQLCNLQHSWEEKGDYQVKVKSRDRCYAETEWSEPLEVSMPKNKVIQRNIFSIFYTHPNIYKLLQYIIFLIESDSNR